MEANVQIRTSVRTCQKSWSNFVLKFWYSPSAKNTVFTVDSIIKYEWISVYKDVPTPNEWWNLYFFGQFAMYDDTLAPVELIVWPEQGNQGDLRQQHIVGLTRICRISPRIQQFSSRLRRELLNSLRESSNSRRDENCFSPLTTRIAQFSVTLERMRELLFSDEQRRQ